MRIALLTISLILFAHLGFGQPSDLHTTNYQVQRDLSFDLRIYDPQQKIFVSPEKKTSARTLYLEIDIAEFKNRYLEINCKKGTSIFIDNYLYATLGNTHQILSIDSLLKVWPKGDIQIGFYHSRMDAKYFSVKLIKKVQASPDLSSADITKRTSDPKKDFLVLASIILLTAFAALIRSNPKLTADYLSVTRMLAIREREETILNTRLTSRTNLLYYAFCALLAALLFIIVFSGTPDKLISQYIAFDSVTEALTIWGLMTGVIFVLIFLKMVILFLLASLFDLSNFLSIHYFNFLRLSTMVFGLGLVFSLGYFFATGMRQSVLLNEIVLGFVQWAFGLWLIVLFLKLIARSEYRFSHLFSYICASEIIPFLVIIKVIHF